MSKLREEIENLEVTVKGCDEANPCIVTSKMFSGSVDEILELVKREQIGFYKWLFDNYQHSIYLYRYYKIGDKEKTDFSLDEILDLYNSTK